MSQSSRPPRRHPAPHQRDTHQPGTQEAGNQPNPARAVAARVLTRVLGGAFAAPELDRELKRAHLSSRDAGLATHLVYGTLRYYRPLSAALEPLLRGNTRDSARAVLLAGAFERTVLGTPAHAVVNEYVDLARQGFGPPALVNAVLRKVERLPTTPTLAPWLSQALAEAYGAQAQAVEQSLLEPQPVWLRLTLQGLSALQGEGCEVGQHYGDVYAVQLSRPLAATTAYSSGWAQPINPASYACVLALAPQPEDLSGLRVLDLAGGAGVKAAMLASHGALVTSVDIAESKARPARQNLGRLHLKAEFVTADLTTTPDLESAPYVLLDAPCTGTGTLRAHPEIALRLTPQAVEEMAQLQAQMLDAAAPLVQGGGVLVYSVCSVTRSEGEAQITAFLQRHPEFSPAPLPDLQVPTQPCAVGVLTRMQDGIDGFYMARLQKA